MRRIGFSLLAVLAATAPTARAETQEFCGLMSTLLRSVNETGFDGQGVALSGKPNCGRSLNLMAQQAHHCSWSYEFRSQASIDAFLALSGSLELCNVEDGSVVFDSDVNHPDFYDLRTYDFPQGKVHASIKDKGGLDRTIIFVRIVPNTNNDIQE